METDVLIIGAGIAGGVAALKAAQAGARVALLHRSFDSTQKNTHWAQGGIIYTGPGDSPELLVQDILMAGAGMSLPEAARVLAEEGPRRVKEILIDALKVPFDRTEAIPGALAGEDFGEFDITEEAAHSVPRILHAHDHTGQAIDDAIEKALAAHPGIKLLRPWVAIDLLTLSHHSRNPLDKYHPDTCVGAYALDRETGQVHTILAKETVLATGGLGQLYLHSTNPKGARGDGIAMAYRAGARLLNLEYIQFHPTALYHPLAPRFLISESLRGEGARLTLRNGEEFMQRHHPLGTLAPRDVVARAIHEELLASGEVCVFLDISHKPADWLRGRFPLIYSECMKLGIDITSQPIPVVPAAHYSCGGVCTDLWGRTTLKRLWAVGEVACTGLHGANRLASTSLLEGLVFGYRAAEEIAKNLKSNAYAAYPPIDDWVPGTAPADPALVQQDWMSIKYTMWNYVGLARTRKRLERAKKILRELQAEIDNFYAHSLLDDDLLGLRNGVQAGLAVLYAALQNPVSCGCHYLAGATELGSSLVEVS